MAYHIDDKKVILHELKSRIEQTDLVPSRACLLKDLNEKFSRLEENGIGNLFDLRRELNNPKKMAVLAEKTNIEINYLIMLRREIEGYFPKAFPLRNFNWLPFDEIERLEKIGIWTSIDFYENYHERIKNYPQDGYFNSEIMNMLASLTDLTRCQWINHTAARMLVECEVGNAEELAAANADELYEALDRVNKFGQYFKGKIGLRDVKRIIKAASYVPRFSNAS